MSETREKDLQEIRDARIIDLLYGEGGGASQEDSEQREAVESLHQPLAIWREMQEEVSPPPEVRAKVLEAAAKKVKTSSPIPWWRELLFVFVRKPAVGVALGLVVIFGVVMHFGVFRRQKPSTSPEVRNRAPSEGRPASREDTVAMLDEETTEKKDTRSEEKIQDGAELETQTGSVKEQPQDKGTTANEKPAPLKMANNQTDKLAYKSLKKSEDLLDGRFGSGKRARRRVPAGSSKRSTRRERDQDAPAPEQKIAGKKRVSSLIGGTPSPTGGTGGDTSQSAGGRRASYYTNAVQLQRQNKHTQATKLFSKAYKNAATQGERDRVLLRWAKSELAKGNKKKATRLISQIRAKKGWVGREVASLRKRISSDQEKTKRTRRKATKKSKKAYPAARPASRK